ENQERRHFNIQPGAEHLVPRSRQEGRKALWLARLPGENAGMDKQVLQLAEQLLAAGFLKLSERERRVITGVAKRTQISRDVNRTFAEKQTLGDRLADHVASFGGSWTFIALCLVALIAWTALNSIVRAWEVEPFDPYPYIFLNLILSMLAALQAPIILMSHDRPAARDRLADGP